MFVFLGYFMLIKRGKFIFVFGILMVILFSLASFAGAQEGFETSSVLLKVSLEQGKMADRTISISSDKGGEFILGVENVPGVSLSEDRFVLNLNENKEVSVKFDSAGLNAGVYVGAIRISGGSEGSLIPVIFEVESKDTFFDINLDIPPQYTDLKPGDKLLAQVKIFDLVSGGTTDGLGATNVDTEYYIYSITGQVLSSESERVVVDVQTRITKTVSLPADIPVGDYVFVSLVRYKDSVGVSSQLFSVSKQGFSFSEGSFGNVGILIIIGVALVLLFFLIVLGLFVYLMRSRDKMLLELRRYNNWEMQKEKQNIAKEEKVVRKKGPVIYKIFKKKVKTKIRKLKHKQHSRILRFREFKKRHNTAAMLAQVRQWKVQGYNTANIEKLVKPSVKDMKSQLNVWKSKYRTEGYKKKKI